MAVVIDAQNDFVLQSGALAIPGAEDDMKRLGTFLEKYGDYIGTIIATKDMHKKEQIFHPAAWKKPDGSFPEPFTFITPEAIDKGDIKCRLLDKDRARDSVASAFEANKRGLIIWPYHCLKGTTGCGIFAPIFRIFLNWWQKIRDETVTFSIVEKGYDDDYSDALGAVKKDYDPSETYTNKDFVDAINKFLSSSTDGKIIFAGEALSHCVMATIDQVIDYFKNEYKNIAERIFVLIDCTSPVSGVGESECIEKLKKLETNIVVSTEAENWLST